MKGIFLVLSLFIVTVSSASFDLMLLPGADGRVHRYDPANRIGLGSYNSDINVLQGVTIDQSTRQAITYGSRVRFTNFDTGAHQYSFPQPSQFRYVHYNQADNQLVAMLNSGGIIRKLDLTTGGVLNTAVLNSTTVGWSGAMVYRNTMTFVGYNNSGFIHYCSMDMNTFVVSGITATPLQVGNVALPSNGVVGFATAQNGVLGGFVARRGSGPSAWSFFSMLFNGAGQPLGMAGSVDLPDFDQFDLPKLALGHQSIYAIGRDSTTATATRFTQLDQVFNPSLMGSWTHTFSTTFDASDQIANVVAPEPGSMIALALGIGILARRRKAA